MKKNVAGPAHSTPKDLRDVIKTSKAAEAMWTDITPLARSEWVCWVISGKKLDTRGIRIDKTLAKLQGGMRRPCCFAGCPHRNTQS